MTKKKVDKIEPKSLIKLSNTGYVRGPVEAFKELTRFAAVCEGADDVALVSCSKRLLEALAEFAKVLDRIHNSDSDLYFAGLLAQADAILKSVYKDGVPKP